MNKLYIGIDTSCYTTSLCIVDETGALVWEKRKLLEVPEGKRGLAQSNMVFQHTKNLPFLFEQIPAHLQLKERLGAVTVSTSPRRQEGSYMPAFLTGYGYGRTLAHMGQVPLYEISHQENHIFAAFHEFPELIGQPCYALHLSGGTTDLLEVLPATEGLQIHHKGGTMDISAGQLIDRVGVALGLPFPAGSHLESLVRWQQPWEEALLRFTVRKGYVSLAGPESQLQRFIQTKEYEKEYIATCALQLVYRALQRILKQTFLQTDIPCCIAVGGVMANQYLRDGLTSFLRTYKRELKTALPKYSSDNALGAAYYGYWKEVVERGCT